ncbi:hypothetical protein LEP1GSC081_0443 [Leptospira kirschneri str. H1]|uniref:Uncharacterized protein n=1 Tax=Leptospira kirschneri str. H1 TaxID=1049966 RepID=A0A0E2BK05_9LEPT|nr:hypothetical protein LEP1GSC081_0443 [Leptospira kirschneri str. H1]
MRSTFRNTVFRFKSSIEFFYSPRFSYAEFTLFDYDRNCHFFADI